MSDASLTGRSVRFRRMQTPRLADVIPMDKILRLFDQLLVGPPSLPLYVGIAILRQLRGTLLAAGFNESIMIFSDTPDVDISACLAQVRLGTHATNMALRRPNRVVLAKDRRRCRGPQAMSMARQTPPSIVRRVRDKPPGSADAAAAPGDAVR